MNTPRFIFIHHTSISFDQNPDQWKATENYHKKKGWGRGGYNLEISKAGSVHQFREDGETTAAQYQKDMNDGRAISICLDGNFDREEPTDEQCQAVWDLIQSKMALYQIPEENVFKHRDVAPKTCPGALIPDDVYGYFRKRVGASDVAEWAKEAREFVMDAKISNGEEPTSPVTRQEVWVMLHRLDQFIRNS